MISRKLSIVALLLLAIPLSACEGEECREAKKQSEIEEKTAEKVEGWMDTAEAYDNQRERIAALSKDLRDDRLKLTRMREGARDVVIDQLLGKSPDKVALRKAVSDAKSKMMPINYRVVDASMVAGRMFTTEQRDKIQTELTEPPEPFALNFLARRGIDVFLYQLDATDEQSEAIWKTLRRTEKDVNAMMTTQHKITKELLGEWVKKDASKDKIVVEVDKSANLVTTFIHTLTDRSVDVLALLRPEQRAKVNERLVRGKTCTP